MKTFKANEISVLLIFLFALFFYSCKKDSALKELSAVTNTTNDSSSNWTQITPFPEYNWLSISFVGDDTVFVIGSRNSTIPPFKLIRSTDGGLTWSSICTLDTNWFDVNFIDQNVGLMTALGNSFSRTTNGGITWNTTNLGLEKFNNIYKINKNHIIAYGNYRFYESTDQGLNWTINPSVSAMRACDFVSDSVGFMLGANGGLKTTDAGASWATIGNYNPNFLKMDYLNKDSAVTVSMKIVGSIPTPEYYFSKTSDGGLNWTHMQIIGQIRLSSSNLCILFDSSSAIYVGGNDGIYVSSDFGNSFTKEFESPTIRAIAKVNNHIIAVGDNGAIIRK